ncbi:hypothetical protein CU097_010869 [Rhizopus azygosporus]|uniref:Uncharacterized protein n=1 Tax=Rhizopus azygosporus TaxID=86630 RepID=A0A367JWY0_RHIAZ|nr:hypothetical protein CU097_010869 [Rhizopus azygosporus]
MALRGRRYSIDGEERPSSANTVEDAGEENNEEEVGDGTEGVDAVDIFGVVDAIDNDAEQGSAKDLKFDLQRVELMSAGVTK